jgi:RNA polymerase sigma factor (sigma-70 family)
MDRTSSNYTDQDLISLCLKGQELGYSMLYERYSKSVFNSICRLLNYELEEAKDVLQEVFVSVFSNIKLLNEVSSVEAWLKRIAINRSISHLRKKQKHQLISLEQIQVEEVERATEEDISWHHFQLQELETAIQRLPEESRMIVQLFVFEDLRHEEIGKILGLNHSSVRVKYHRAKLRLAEELRTKLGMSKASQA